MDSVATPSIEAVKALDGKNFAMLSEEERQVLHFYLDRGRKHGVNVEIVSDADGANLARASREQADEILARANSHVKLTVN
jgi:hypothetical protein